MILRITKKNCESHYIPWSEGINWCTNCGRDENEINEYHKKLGNYHKTMLGEGNVGGTHIWVEK
jgi:hypothetical protein